MKIKPNDTKMKELILHVAQASDKDEKFGAQKLNKLLFYADFLLPLKESMISKGDIAIKKTPYFGFQQQRIVALRPPDYSKLEAEEVALIDYIIKKYADKNGAEISDESHNFAGWKIAYETGPKTPIPYSIARFDLSAFGIETPQLPQSLVNHAKALDRRLSDSQKTKSLAA